MVHAIANYFEVPASHFLDDVVEETDAAVARQRTFADEKQVREIAARARGLNLGTLRRIAEIVNDARILDGLDEMSDMPTKG